MRTIKKAVRQSTKYIGMFFLGNLIQLVFHAVSQNFWDAYQIPFCAAAGTIVMAAIILGVRISAREAKEYTRYEDMQ